MLTYRAEVDGLRALAVIPVLLFHGQIPGFAGGYIGVDIFFVISGFLIGSIIIGEAEAGRFSLLRFYERRARRILPALTVVLAFSTVAAFLVLTPGRLVDYGHYLAGTVLFVSNMVYWQKTHYFAASAEENPLLHTWSLAIEEQFYLFFPLYVMWVWHRGLRFNWRLLAAIALVSFLYALYKGQRDPTENFFLLPGRVWELLAGVLAAMLLRYRAPSANSVLAWLGLILLLAGFLLIDGDTLFPGPMTLLPVVGTALLLLYARDSNSVARLLALKPLVAIGLISYSLYLWHQPLLAFARLIGPDPHLSMTLSAALLALSFPMAWLSYRFVESPFRRPGGITAGALMPVLGLPAMLLVGCAATVHLSGGVPDRYTLAEQARLAEIENGTAYVISGFNERVSQAFADRPGRRVLLVGDSYAQDTFNVLTQAGLLTAEDNIVTAIVPGACQFVISDDDLSGYREPGTAKLCRRTDENIQLIAELTAEADWLIIAASWREWGLERLPTTLSRLPLDDHTAVTVFGSKGFEPVSHFAYLYAPTHDWLSYPGYFDLPAERAALNAQLAERLAGLSQVQFIDWFSLYCDGAQCRNADWHGRLLSYDGGHLTRSGAYFFANELTARYPVLP